MAERRPVVRSLPSAASRLRADVLRRPSATALLVLVFAGGLGLGSFAHLVMAGDHRATEIADRAAASGALTRNYQKHQFADLDAIRDAEEAQMRSGGIVKGLLVLAVLLLLAIAVALVLRLAAEERRSG